ncbi:uncharacterized protein LOC133778803 [Humulus lupulus]|uniref:uncharacterized protein LOC133778803 n=1 Tax=Humulus lupulus TaxID=3486 RepID=UPI002B40FB0E|nr:uncharacterized protein LOC133778803 [Humulus lupulus]
MVALIARNKVKFVTGKLPQPPPDDDDDYDPWCRCNSLVISWILHAISSDIADNIMYLGDASLICSELHESFHQNNGPRVFEVKQSIQVLVQGNNNIQTYFTWLKGLWDLVKEFRPQPICSCGDMKTFLDYQEHDKEERQRGLNHVSSESLDTNTHNFGQFAGSAHYNRPKATCSHCGNSGHTIAKCYKIHGYPPRHKFHGKGRQPFNTSNKLAANLTGVNDEKSGDNLEQNYDIVSSLSAPPSFNRLLPC